MIDLLTGLANVVLGNDAVTASGALGTETSGGGKNGENELS